MGSPKRHPAGKFARRVFCPSGGRGKPLPYGADGASARNTSPVQGVLGVSPGVSRKPGDGGVVPSSAGGTVLPPALKVRRDLNSLSPSVRTGAAPSEREPMRVPRKRRDGGVPPSLREVASGVSRKPDDGGSLKTGDADCHTSDPVTGLQ